MNAESSRSHTIYRLSIESEEVDDDEEETKARDPSTPGGVTRMSFLNLVDLAGPSLDSPIVSPSSLPLIQPFSSGSERQKSTNATGKTLKEGANINKSLLALGAVINKLGEASKPKVRFILSSITSRALSLSVGQRR
jgi:centromeric protein E